MKLIVELSSDRYKLEIVDLLKKYYGEDITLIAEEVEHSAKEKTGMSVR